MSVFRFGPILLIATTLVSSCAHQNTTGSGLAVRDPAQASVVNLMDQRNRTEYDVLFTDPVCLRYNYKTPLKNSAGGEVTSKPKNIYCRNLNDIGPSGKRPESPQFRLVEWVKDPSTKEIFFTYLSFRNKTVKNAMCERVKASPDFKVTFVMSSSEDATAAEELKACGLPGQVEYKKRGLEGEIGYAHNKIFIVIQKNLNQSTSWRSQLSDGERIGIVFSSGNMTSGPVMHHENWHFIKTDAGTHFAQMHMCVLNAEWNDATGRERNAYMQAVASCRQDLKNNGKPEESDIHAFFVPGEGESKQGILDNGTAGRSAWDYMRDGDGINPGIRQAGKIWLGAHRFFYSKMIYALQNRMLSDDKPDLRILVDDDTYYKFKDPGYGGDTMPDEWSNIEQLVSLGASAKLMETNAEEHQLHHSKYLIFLDKEGTPKGLFCGAANLTGAGFTKNWENTYYVTVPSILTAFKNHYIKYWDGEATTRPGRQTTQGTPVTELPDLGHVDPFLDDGTGTQE